MKKFVGTGKKITDADVAEAAAVLKVAPSRVRAVMEVEARNSGFDSMRRPTILFEPHIFFKYVNQNKKAEALKIGVAYPRQGMKPYPKSASGVWVEFEKAYKLDPTAAMLSTSWGLGQIMGFNHKIVGYPNVESMVQAFMQSEGHQLMGMVNFIQSRKIDRHLRSGNFEAFAYVYNGKNHAKFKYADKLRSADQRWSKKAALSGPEEVVGVLQIGSTGERVKALQVMLTNKGYTVKVDKIFGTRTRDAVLAWKADNELPLIPTITPQDLVKLDNSPDRPIAPERSEATVKDLVKEGSSIAKNGKLLEKLGAGGLAVTGGAEIAERTGITTSIDQHLEKAEEAVQRVEKGLSFVDTVTDVAASATKFIIANKTLFTMIIMAAIMVVGYRVVKARLNDYREGKTI